MAEVKKKCPNYKCDKFEEGMSQVIDAQYYASPHMRGNHGIKYTAGPFKYCPWCGTKLEPK